MINLIWWLWSQNVYLSPNQSSTKISSHGFVAEKCKYQNFTKMLNLPQFPDWRGWRRDGVWSFSDQTPPPGLVVSSPLALGRSHTPRWVEIVPGSGACGCLETNTKQLTYWNFAIEHVKRANLVVWITRTYIIWCCHMSKLCMYELHTLDGSTEILLSHCCHTRRWAPHKAVYKRAFACNNEFYTVASYTVHMYVCV